uniref:Uncharacterized protein n=1 Tax=Clastoptera arizonana TaxID=38151 RepID=A0A1B6CI27_9HEMI
MCSCFVLFKKDRHLLSKYCQVFQLHQRKRSFQVFYKPSFFEYQMNSYIVNDLSSNQAESKLVNETSVSKSTSKAKDQSKTSVKHELKASAKHESRNKLAIKGKEVAADNLYSSEYNKSCFYFISDSPFCKTFYFTASSLESENGNSYFYVIGEKFNWRNSNLGEIVFVLKSTFLKSIVLKLGPGLQLLRIWFKFPKSFSFHIYSSTAFTTCNKFKMQEILACDSLSYNLYGNKISEAFKILLESCPGGQEHGESYTNFIHSFNPPQWTKQLQWPYWFTAELDIQNIFEECIIELLVKELPPSDGFFKTVEALKMIFLSPKFGDKAMEVLSGEHSDYFNQQKLSIGKSQLESVEKLTKQEKQSKSKKGDKGKSSPRSDKSTKPSAKKTESSKKSGKTSEKPKCLINRFEVPLECLLLSNSENAKKLMRLMMEKLPQMLKYYPLKTDYIHHLVYHDYVGECNVYNGWVFFYRCLMNLHTNKATACGFHLMTEISKVTTHVIDMDTLNEIYLGLSENTVCTLSRNTKGYLVCAYGKMKNSAKKTIPWKLRIIGEIDVDLIHPCLLNDPAQCVFEQVLPYQSLLHTDGYYIPNRWNIIGRCLIEVKCGVNVLLRLALSGYNVQCLLKLNKVSGKNVVFVEGESEIILPSVYLEGPLEGEESALYEVEIRLINDSWPLTNNEKEACYIMKETIQDHFIKCCDPRYSTNTNECLIKKGLSIEKNGECWWEVIIVCEEAKVNLFPDKRIYENLHEYIQDWSIKEGSRLKRGLVYRNKFRASILKEETDDIKIIETTPTIDLFNLNQIRITNLLKEYDEPEYEAIISSFQDDCLSEKELIEAQEEFYTDIIMQRQKRLHSSLAQYTKEENERYLNSMQMFYKSQREKFVQYFMTKKELIMEEVKTTKKVEKKKKKK